MIFCLFCLVALVSAFSNEPSLIASLENDPSALVEGKVNVITGDPILFEEDLVVQGAEPIHLSRSYCNSDKGSATRSGWNTYAVFSDAHDLGDEKWVVKEPNGSPIVYRKIGQFEVGKETFYRYEPDNLDDGFSNTSHGEISSRTNLKNNYIIFDVKYKYLVVHCADGTLRNYKKLHKLNGKFCLRSQQLTNGNWMLYDYGETSNEKKENVYFIKSIQTTNPAKDKVYARVDIIIKNPQKEDHYARIVASDGQVLEHHYERDEQGIQSGALSKVISAAAPNHSFIYTKYKQMVPSFSWTVSPVEEHRLSRVELPLGRFMQFDYYNKERESFCGQMIQMEDDRINWKFQYDPRRSRVKTISKPIGSTTQVTHSFLYDLPNRKTTVIDIQGHRIDYSWDGAFRLIKIERFSKEGNLLNGESFSWGYSGQNVGNLLSKSFFDSSGAILLTREYTYDSRGNVLEEKLKGNLTGLGNEEYSKRSTYSSTEPNLLLEVKETNGLRQVYEYLPGTDLLTSRKIFDRQQLIQRTTWKYNRDNLLVKEIHREGDTHLIKEFFLHEDQPYLGMPYAMEERYRQNGREHLLKRTVYTRGTGGRIRYTDIYDANQQFRYRLTTLYDEKLRPKEQTNALGQVRKTTYDLVGNPILLQEPRLQQQMSYDRLNQLLSIKKQGDDAVCQTTQYDYDNRQRLSCETDFCGGKTTYHYDVLGRKKRVELPAISTITGAQMIPIFRQKYDSAGNPILKIDAEGNETQYTYNAYGKPILIIHPDGAKEKYTYTLDGSLKTYTDPTGIVTTYEYDALKRMLSKKTASAIERFEYRGQQLLCKIDREGNRTQYTYDGAGRKIAEQCGQEQITFSYDPLGRLQQMQQEDLITIFEYDLLDRLLVERKESTTGQLLRKIAYEYDEAGNQTAVIQFLEAGESKEISAYDSIGRLIKKTDPLGFVQTISYDDRALKKVHTDPLGLQTIESYNALHKIASIEKGKGQTRSLEKRYYNKNGQLTQRIYGPKKIRIQQEYDNRSRLKTLVEAAGTVEAKTTRYAYTLRSELEQVTKPDGTVLFYQYNPLGFNTSLHSSDGSVRHAMQYNLLGKLLETDGIRRTLDAKGRLLSETFAHYTITHTYDKRGRRQETILPQANCALLYSYNPTDLIHVERKTLDGTILYGHNYQAYDLAGNLLQEQTDIGPIGHTYDACSRKATLRAPNFVQCIDRRDPMGNILTQSIQSKTLNKTSTYSYDDLYQLTSESGPISHTYRYDTLYNRTQKDHGKYILNDLQQLTSHFVYNKNGNPIQQGNTRYTYDALDRLIQLETPTLLQTYTYDSLHRCLTKTTNHKTQYFLYDQQQEIGSFDETHTLQELRILGATPHAEIGAAIGIELQGHLYIPVHDIQGNVVTLQSLSDQSVRSFQYTAFGEQPADTHPNPWRYSSKRTDATTNLVYYGRRFYHPDTGRWLTPDPAGFADGLNLYTFVQNDPLIHIDEYGLVTQDHKGNWVNCPWNSPYSSTTPSRGQDHYRTVPLQNPLPKLTPHYYVNGILNNRSDNLQGARSLQATLGQANLVPFHSESFGPVKDLYSVYKSKHDPHYSTFAIRRLNRELQMNTLSLEALQDPRKVFVTCFSRGATDTYHAVKNLTASQKSRLIITACGPIMVLPRDLGFSVTNLISEGDWCSQMCNLQRIGFAEEKQDFSRIFMLPQQDGFSGFIRDHFFQSQTYQNGIKQYTTELYKKYGSHQ